MLFGASGFLGGAIYSELLRDGYKVIPLSSNRGVSKSFIPLDFHDSEQCRKIMENFKPDVVISTPWVTALPDYRTSELNPLFKDSTIKLARIALSVGTGHFLAFGSSAEYGNSNLECDSSKTIPKPIDLYGRTKYETYLELARIFENSQTEFNWLRVFQPYGEHQDSHRLIPHLVSEIRAGRSPMLKDPNRISDWVSTKDIASAALFLMKKKLPQAIDVGSSVGTSNLEIEAIIRNILQNGSSGNMVPPRTENAQGLVVSSESPILLNGWRPQLSLNDSLALLYGSPSETSRR
jgi:nucleoside-diphosphate-sugar epimerase